MKTKNIKSSPRFYRDETKNEFVRTIRNKNTVLLFVLFVSFRFSLISQTPGEWTWMHGDNTPNSLGVFGVRGVANPANTPPGLYEPCEWRDNNGNFWLFAGQSAMGGSAALWKYDPNINQWTWMKGPSAFSQPGVYGTQGVSSPANYPGSRMYAVATWTDTSGNLWLFGGLGSGFGVFNDLWKYTILTNEWTWMKGPNTANDPGSYGIKGVPNSANLPPSRSETSCTWTDKAGNLWLYGGFEQGTTNAMRGDLWKYDISTNEWTWMHGSNAGNPPAVYGTQGVAAPSNTPGRRVVYCSWTGLAGNLWLFGGFSTNDLWMYDPNPASPTYNQWTWIKGPKTINNPGNYGTKCVSAANNIPPARFENRARVRDACGNFWNFGGATNSGNDIFNDLWHYNVSTNRWTWVSGDNTSNQTAVYGTKGISSPANKPGAKYGGVAWIDNNGYIYVFGGNEIKFSNDLFRYVPDTACVPVSAVVKVSSNTTICNGQSTTLIASGGTSYSWLPGGQTTMNIIISPSISTTYTVIGNGACGSDSSSVTVTVSPLPSITTSSIHTICSGQSASLTASGGNSYVWYPGGQSDSSIVVIPTVTTTYTVIGSTANSCTAAATTTIAVNTSPAVAAWYNITITAGSSTTLSSNSNPSSVTYIWSPAAGLSCTTCQNPVAAPSVTTIYCVTVIDSNGCTDTDCITITVEPLDCSGAGEIYLPNAFSPNNDGENDVLQIYYGNINCIKSLQLVIYDRWGEKVFETTDPAFTWDGNHQGKSMNTALASPKRFAKASVFVYYLEATLINGETIIKKGNVSLIK